MSKELVRSWLLELVLNDCKIIRAGLITISVLTILSEARAYPPGPWSENTADSSVSLSEERVSGQGAAKLIKPLPELDRQPLLRTVSRPRAPGRSPSKYSKVPQLKQEQKDVTPQDEDNEAILTWDYIGYITLLYGVDSELEDVRLSNKRLEDLDNELAIELEIGSKLDRDVPNALYPFEDSSDYILDSVLQANEEADALDANNNADNALIVEDMLVLQEIEQMASVMQEAEENDSLSLPELDRQPLLRTVSRPRAPGRRPSKYSKVPRLKQEQKGVTPQDEDNEAVLTWDDSDYTTVLYGVDSELEDVRLNNKRLEDWDLDDELAIEPEIDSNLDLDVPNEISPTPASSDYILDSVLQTNEEADALEANNNADNALIVEDILVLQEIEQWLQLCRKQKRMIALSIAGTLGTNDAFDDNSVAYEDEKKTGVTAVIKEFLEQTSLEEDLENEENSKNNTVDHADNSVTQQLEEQANKPADEPIARGAEQVLANARVYNAERASMVVRGHNQLIMSVIDQRMNTNASSKALGVVGAGDETDNQHGIWVSPFIGNSAQKFSAGISDYKSKNSGVTLGYDGFVSDNLLLGYSYTGATTKIKYKNEKLGDESKVRSNIYSIYGLYNVPNKNWFISGIGLYGDSIVKNYVQRAVIIGNKISGYQIAYSKHKSYVYTGQLMVGYNYTLSSSASFKPMIGIRYDKMRDASYQESGTDYQNLTVKGISASLIEGMVGVRGAKDMNTGHMIITPEIYGFVRRNFRDKASAIDARLFGMDNPLPSMALTRAKTSINFGGGITAKYKSYEYGINYNSNIANKYLAHQASVKLRVNF